MKKSEFLRRDRLLRAIGKNGHFRISVIKTTEIVRTAREKHGLSEQIPSAVSLDVALDEKGGIAEAGGVLVQAMPGASKEEIVRLEDNIRNMPTIGLQLADGYLEEVLSQVSKDIEVKELMRYPTDFFCRCSKDRFRRSLALLDPDELLAMEGETEELVCHYCSRRYIFSRQELDAIAQKAKIRQN